MAVAGKIMPRPRGPYDPSAVYDILDMVTLKNKLWMAKKSNIANEEPKYPSEYWMLCVDGTTDVHALETEMGIRFNDVNKELTRLNNELSNTILSFKDVEVPISSFVSDSTYPQYPYKAELSCPGVTSNYVPEIMFGLADAVTGIFSPIAESGTDTVTIYASSIPSSIITIPSIICIKTSTGDENIVLLKLSNADDDSDVVALIDSTNYQVDNLSDDENNSEYSYEIK